MDADDHKVELPPGSSEADSPDPDAVALEDAHAAAVPWAVAWDGDDLSDGSDDDEHDYRPLPPLVDLRAHQALSIEQLPKANDNELQLLRWATKEANMTQAAYKSMRRLPVFLAWPHRLPRTLDTLRRRCLKLMDPVTSLDTFLKPAGPQSEQARAKDIDRAPYSSIINHIRSLVLAEETFHIIRSTNEERIFPFLDDIENQASRREDCLRPFYDPDAPLAEGSIHVVDMSACTDAGACIDHQHVVSDAWDGTLWLRTLAASKTSWHPAWVNSPSGGGHGPRVLFVHHTVFLDGYDIRNYEFNGGYVAAGACCAAPYSHRCSVDSPMLSVISNFNKSTQRQHLKDLLLRIGADYHAGARGVKVTRGDGEQVIVFIVPFSISGDMPGRNGTGLAWHCAV